MWRDHNFDGILNPGEEVIAGRQLSVTQWFYVDDPALIAALAADPENFAVDEIDNVISRNADKTPAETVKAAWVHAKTKAEKAADKAAAEADGSVSTIDPTVSRSTFERPVAVTDGATGVYKFEKLPSFVYLGGSFTAADEGDEDTPATDASNDIEVIQPNDTTDTLEANQVDLDKLYLASYRITLAEVAPDYALTGLHVGVNIGDKTLGSLSTITAPGADGNPLPGESADNDAFRPNPSGDRVIQVVEEFFDNSWNGEGTFEEYEQNTDKNYGDDKRDEANENKNNASFWRTDGYVIVAARSADGNRYNDAGTARDAASYQYEQIYNGVRYDVPRPMFAQSGGQAGLVKIPRTSLTGRVWDDTGAYNADGTYDLSCGYNGVQDEGERGLAGQIVYLTQWYWKPAVETGNTVTGEGEWVQNTAFGEDTYTSNKYSRADGEAVAPIIYITRDRKSVV